MNLYGRPNIKLSGSTLETLEEIRDVTFFFLHMSSLNKFDRYRMNEMIERFLYYNKKRENISFRQKYITAAKVDDTLTYFFFMGVKIKR